MLLKTLPFNPGLPFRNGLFQFPIPSSEHKSCVSEKASQSSQQKEGSEGSEYKTLGTALTGSFIGMEREEGGIRNTTFSQ